MAGYKLPSTLGRSVMPEDRSRVLSYDNSAMSRVSAEPVARAINYNISSTLKAQEAVIQTNMQAARQMEQLGQNVRETGAMILKEEKRQDISKAQQASLDMQTELQNFKYGDGTTPGLFSRKGADTFTARKDFDEKFSELKEKYGAGIADPDALAAFNEDAKRMLNSNIDDIGRWQMQEEKNYRATLLDSDQLFAFNQIGVEYNNDEKVNANIANIIRAERAKAMEDGLLPGTPAFDMRIKSAESKAQMARINAMMMEGSPQSVIKAKNMADKLFENDQMLFTERAEVMKVMSSAYPEALAQAEWGGLQSGSVQTYEEDGEVKLDKNELINWMIDDIEGGDVLVDEPNGHKARYGINSGFLELINKRDGTNLRVEDLTRADAEKIYDSEFLNNKNYKNASPEMKALVFDTLVNHGAGRGADLVERAGNNPQALLQLRAKEYMRLASANPEEYASSLDGWMNRLEKVAGKLQGGVMPSRNTVMARANELERQAPGAGEKLLALHDKAIKAQEAEKKVQTNEFYDRVMPILEENNGQWELLPAADIALAKNLGHDVLDKVKNYTGTNNESFVTYIDTLPAEEFMVRDFEDPEYRHLATTSTIEGWKKKQIEMREDPAKLGTEKTVDEYVAYLFEKNKLGQLTFDKGGELIVDQYASGYDKEKVAEVYSQMAAFKRDLELDINATKRATGKDYLNKTEVQGLADNLMMRRLQKQSAGVWGWLGYEDTNKYKELSLDDLTESQIKDYESKLRRDGELITRDKILSIARQEMATLERSRTN